MQQYDGVVNQKHVPVIFRVFFALIQQIYHGDKLLGIYWLLGSGLHRTATFCGGQGKCVVL